MTLLQNLTASTNADLIGNDANPTLTIRSTVGGIAVQAVGGSGIGLTASGSGASVAIQGAALNSGNAGLFIGSANATAPYGGSALVATFGSNVSTATVAPLTLVASTASQALINIQGVFISTASISMLAAQSAFYIPVYHQTQAVWGYVFASKGPA